MSNRIEADKTAHQHDDDPLTGEEIEAIQESRSGKVRGKIFDTADEAIRWLNE